MHAARPGTQRGSARGLAPTACVPRPAPARRSSAPPDMRPCCPLQALVYALKRPNPVPHVRPSAAAAPRLSPRQHARAPYTFLPCSPCACEPCRPLMPPLLPSTPGPGRCLGTTSCSTPLSRWRPCCTLRLCSGSSTPRWGRPGSGSCGVAGCVVPGSCQCEQPGKPCMRDSSGPPVASDCCCCGRSQDLIHTTCFRALHAHPLLCAPRKAVFHTGTQVPA